MKIKMTFLLLVAGLLILPGCKSKHEKLTEKMMDNMEETLAIMKGITTAKEAKAAQPQLEKIQKQMNELTKEAKELGPPSKEEEEKLKEKYEDRMKELTKELLQESMRVAQIRN